jgi:hypothetical protein
VVIQIAPHSENSPVSGVELPHQGGTAKKEGLGVFAKILAGLLRKAGEKDGKSVSAGDEAAKNLKPGIPGITESKFSPPDEMAALFSGPRQAGKKPVETLGPGIAGRVPGEEKTDLLAAAGDPADREKGPEGGAGAYLPVNLPQELRGGEGKAGGTVKAPVKPELSLESSEEISAPEAGGFFALEGLDFGDSLGTPLEGAEEEGGVPGNRKGKAGDKPVYVDSPEENFFSPPREANPGLIPGGPKGEGPGGGEPRSRLTEARQKEKRRDKITLEVQDFRTREDRNSAPASQSVQGLEPRPLAGRGEMEILVELRGENSGRGLPQAADHTWESRAGRGFEDFLARELHQNLNGDIVRHASVALRDGGEGTIRLSLRPESLGNVKIRLEMADNKVTGHIVVESETAFRAFEREVTSLEQAFRDSGFDGASLDMSLAQGGGGTQGGWTGEEAGRPSLPERLAALSYDAALEGLEASGGGPEAPAGIYTRNGRRAVNMLV